MLLSNIHLNKFDQALEILGYIYLLRYSKDGIQLFIKT